MHIICVYNPPPKHTTNIAPSPEYQPLTRPAQQHVRLSAPPPAFLH